jgi:hypothetical protein
MEQLEARIAELEDQLRALERLVKWVDPIIHFVKKDVNKEKRKKYEKARECARAYSPNMYMTSKDVSDIEWSASDASDSDAK